MLLFFKIIKYLRKYEIKNILIIGVSHKLACSLLIDSINLPNSTAFFCVSSPLTFPTLS